MRVQAVAPGQHPGDALIRAPRHGVALAPGVELKAGILVMQGVVVPAGKERAYHEPHARCRRPQPPRQDHACRPTRDEQLLFDLGIVFEPEQPGRPRGRGERLEPAFAVRRRDAGRVALRAQGEAPPLSLDPAVAAVHEGVAPRGWSRRGEEQGVIPPRPHPRRLLLRAEVRQVTARAGARRLPGTPTGTGAASRTAQP